jgi:hypothetical protein
MLYFEGMTLPPIYTLEEPWRNNERRVSCVPKGTYECKPHTGLRFQNVWRLHGVPNRDAILIHAGNTTDDIEGCILIGMDHGVLRNKRAVLRSGEALKELQRVALNKTFTLIID